MTTRNEQLAAALAREVFTTGDETAMLGAKGKVGRLQFVGGRWPDAEFPMGGLCEEALSNVLLRALNKHMPSAD